MASDDTLNTSVLETAPPKPSSPSSSYFFPWATSPDIIRAHEKDVYLTGTLSNHAQSIIRALRGARFAHANTDTIKNLTEILYLSLTTLIGNRTLGEEYCDVVQLEDDTLRLPSLARRAGYILSTILVPSILQRLLPALRRRLRAKLEQNIARKQAKVVHFSKEQQQQHQQQQQKSFSLWFQTYILEHLDSLTSLSPIYALNIAAFYFSGTYYHISKRLWGLRYIFSKKIGDSEERIGYEVLGVLLVLQIAVQGVVHAKEVISAAQESEDPTKSAEGEGTGTGTGLKSIYTSPSTPSLPPDTPRYDLSSKTGSAALSWIPAGQQQKCTLCLDPFKDPSVSTCGHVFCWTCIRDWVREKPECPLCRQEALASKIVPLRG